MTDLSGEVLARAQLWGCAWAQFCRVVRMARNVNRGDMMDAFYIDGGRHELREDDPPGWLATARAVDLMLEGDVQVVVAHALGRAGALRPAMQHLGVRYVEMNDGHYLVRMYFRPDVEELARRPREAVRERYAAARAATKLALWRAK